MTTTDFITPETASAILPSAPRQDASPHAAGAAEDAREDAFSAEFHWDGAILHPLSLERYNIFVTQRLAMGAPSLGDALRDGGAFFPDALRLLWLCSHTADVIQRLRRDPDAMQAAIEAWAAAAAPLSRCEEIIGIGLAIFNSAFESRHEARPSSRAGGISGN